MDLYALTGIERYLEASKRFHHHAVLEPLRADRDELPGKHANTQIPKIAGAARSYEVTGDAGDRAIAENFWTRVTERHSWVIGGNSDRESFFEPSSAASHLSQSTAETCNTYNMLKLTEHLFAWQQRVEYADYYERALYNHILASQEPEEGMFAYYLSLKPGHFRTYSTPNDSFWCCVGSGMENHTKYGRAIYFHGKEELFVNLFIPSVLEWKEKGLVIEQRTEYPRENRTTFTVVEAGATPLPIRVRIPRWVSSDATFTLNGAALSIDGRAGRYASIERVWKKGDRLSVTIPMAVRTEPLRGTPDTVALMYGPVVLAGDLGPVERNDTFPYAENQTANFDAPSASVPQLIAEVGSVAATVRKLPGRRLAFSADGRLDGKKTTVTLRPFADLPYRKYNVYWSPATGGDAPSRL
jgi:DUF1680 family protein